MYLIVDNLCCLALEEMEATLKKVAKERKGKSISCQVFMDSLLQSDLSEKQVQALGSCTAEWGGVSGCGAEFSNSCILPILGACVSSRIHFLNLPIGNAS